MSETPYDRLLDPRLGIVLSLTRREHPPEMPPALVSFTAKVCDSRRLGPWQGDRVALGTAFHDPEPARRAAIGEAVERYCGNFIPAGLRRASYRDLRAAGEPALDPGELILYSEKQYAARGFPFVPFTKDLTVLWTAGADLGTGERVLVPASLAYINFFLGERAAEPRTHFVVYSGVAAGPSREAAERSALEELVERDATMIWWMSGSPCRGIDLEASPALRSALASPADDGTVRYHLIEIPTPFEIPAVGALIHDRALEIVALGAACRPDPEAAALKALAEAIHLRSFSKEMLAEDGSVWRSMRSGILDPRAYKPFRADRAYRDSFRPDFRDVTDLGAQAQIYLDPRMHVHVERIKNAPVDRTLADLPAVPGPDVRSSYLEILARRGFRAISVDLTTADVRAAGLSVVRVIVPGLYPNAPAAFPYLGGRRLYAEPAALGWLPAPISEPDLVREPLPHT